MRKKLNLRHPDSVLKKQIAVMHEYDLSKYFLTLNDEEQLRIYQLIDINNLSKFLIELPSEERIYYFNLLEEKIKVTVLKQYSTDELKLFLSDYDLEEQEVLISKLPNRTQKAIKKMFMYEKAQAANFMSTNYLAIQKDLSVGQATNYITQASNEDDYIETIFVLNEEYQLHGLIEIKDLIIARKNDNLNDIIQTNFYKTSLSESIESVVSKIANYDLNVIAVTEDDILIGIITADDVMSFVVDDYETDIEKLTGVGDYDLESKPIARVKNRIFWLLLSISLNLLIASILSVFGQTIEAITALILFQPMILGMAGNIGTQSIAVTILGLHDESFSEQKVVKKHIVKEIIIGLLNSIVIGIIGFIISFIFLRAINTSIYDLKLSITIGLSLFSSMLLSAIMGVLIPVLLKKFKIDPAAASGPLISTFNDLFALFIYFGLATIILL